MSVTVAEADRATLNAAYDRLRKAPPRAPFGMPPRWVVRAYVLARHGRRDATEAVSRAHFGLSPRDLGPGGQQAVRDWLATLDAVELPR